MAGRNISVTHVALGMVPVMRATEMMKIPIYNYDDPVEINSKYSL
jgi:hypothetical protein